MMLKKKEINNLILKFKEERTNYISFKVAQNTVNSDTIDFLISVIEQRKPLNYFLNNINSNRRIGTVLYRFFLKNIYTQNDLIIYVKDSLTAYINGIDELYPLLSTDAFKYLFGYYGINCRTEDDIYYKKVFDDGYSLFKSNSYWNALKISLLINSIKLNDDIAPILDELNKYTQSALYKIHILDNYIIPTIGEKEFKEYVKNRVNYYYENFSEEQSFKNCVTCYFKYIYGIAYDVANPHYESKCVKFMFLEIFKYVQRSCFEAQIKNLNLTDFEIQEIRNSLPITSTPKRHGNSLHKYENVSQMNYGDVKFNDICDCIDSWYEQQKCTNRRSFNKHDSLKLFLADCNNILISKNIKWILYNHTNLEYKNHLRNYIAQKDNELLEYFLKTNKEELLSEKNSYLLFSETKDHAILSQTFDFSTIKSKSFRDLLRLYIKQKFYDGQLFQNNHRNKHFNNTVHFFEFVEYKFDIDEIKNINSIHIQSYLVDLSNKNESSIAKIKEILHALRKFFNFCIEEINVGLYNNPAQTISIKYQEDHLISVPQIPEEIITFLENNISKWSDQENSLIYEIMMWTGLRFSDAISLTVDGIKEVNEELSMITIETSKTKLSLIKNNLDYELSDYIPVNLHKKINRYIEKTNKKRMEYNTKLVFFRIIKGKVRFLDCHIFIRSINCFLEKNNIKTLNNKFWNLTTRQARKTVAYTLINNGASATDVQQKLNHISSKTTKKYYAEVNRKKLAELNHEFYKQQFGYLISDERLELYSEDERKKLYEDFCLNNRLTELGVCTLHPSEGRCDAKINGSCATCSKICTGKKWLDHWIELRNDSANYLKELKNIYFQNNISENEYKNFIEFKQEENILKHYNAVIKAIKDGG